MLPKQVRGTDRKHITKPAEQVAAPPSTYLLQHDLYAVLVRGTLLSKLPAAEVVKVAYGHHAGLGVPHQADVAGQGGVGTCQDGFGSI